MFGYVMANRDALSPEELSRLKSFYCGLCRTLGRRYGYAGQLALSYDMTFLALLLTALYDPQTQSGQERCLLHPAKAHHYIENSYIDYAADMTVVLTYHKALDDWNDDKSLSARARAKAFKSRYERLRALYPRQICAIERSLSELSALEKANCQEIDPPTNAFGEMLGELFVFKKDHWSDTLRTLGSAVGRFIYLMDAYDDLPKDKEKGRFNPLISIAGEQDFEAKCRMYMTYLLGEGTVAFEQLPLVEDVSILRNILYSGIWTRYESNLRARSCEKGKESDT